MWIITFNELDSSWEAILESDKTPRDMTGPMTGQRKRSRVSIERFNGAGDGGLHDQHAILLMHLWTL
jgi:hypothetical protein